MSLTDNDSYFDDMITLYIGKGVASFMSDEKILGPVMTQSFLKLTGIDLTFLRTKLNKARLSQGVDDPRIARNKFINNVVYVKATNKYFDLTTNQEYGKDAINFEYSRLYASEKGGPVTCLGS